MVVIPVVVMDQTRKVGTHRVTPGKATGRVVTRSVCKHLLKGAF